MFLNPRRHGWLNRKRVKYMTNAKGNYICVAGSSPARALAL
ncbi:hypothetical protein ABID20_002030 [Rhizobium alvei]